MVETSGGGAARWLRGSAKCIVGRSASGGHEQEVQVKERNEPWERLLLRLSLEQIVITFVLVRVIPPPFFYSELFWDIQRHIVLNTVSYQNILYLNF